MKKEQSRRNLESSETQTENSKPVVEVKKYSDMELLLRIEAMSRGLVLPDMPTTPVVISTTPVVQVPQAEPAEPPKTDWSKVKHTCPRCSRTGTVSADFGTRMHRGTERVQSWCYACRAATSYYNVKRKYKTSAT